MTEPDDRELQQYLSGDSRVSRLYREAGRETPPPELDAAVLRRAHEAVRRKGASRRWLPPLALAATVLLGVNLAWNVYEQAPPVQVAQERDAPAAAAPVEKQQDAEVRRFSHYEAPSAAALAATAESSAALPPQERKKEAPAAPEADVQPMMQRSGARPAPQEMATSDDAVAAKAREAGNWTLTGPKDARDYAFDRDESVTHSGQGSQVLWRTGEGEDGFARLYREISVEQYRGRQIRITAFLKTENVTQGARFVVRMDYGEGAGSPLFHSSRPMSGDASWEPRRFTVVVPEYAKSLQIGLMLHGRGSAWIDSIQIEDLGIGK